MEKHNTPIGVADSGLGGLSVVLALQKILPQENLIYFGDTANCPYGNKSNDELLSLSGRMLSFLEQQGVKCIALACNTTSALAEPLRSRLNTPLITVAESAADAIGRLGLREVGLLATVSTVSGGIYANRIHTIDPTIQVYSAASRNLAALVENTQTPKEAIASEICTAMTPLLEHKLSHVILGCTHYPLVLDIFERCCPDVKFLDPAPYQALSVREYLTARNLCGEQKKPTLTIYTTGTPDRFERTCKENGLWDHYTVEVIPLNP